MSKIIIEIDPTEREIEITIPIELRKNLSEKDMDKINNKIFELAKELADITNK